jgi:hypothetical protein
MQLGTFQSVMTPNAQKHDLRITLREQARIIEQALVGIKVCPNDACRGLIFAIVSDRAIDRAVVSFPPEVLDFDPSDIPGPIAKSLEEAIQCHAARCYRAAALMVRRVLEELCDERGAQGKDLKERLADLGKVIVVPINLIAAADHLRLLGNDAAHIKATTYDNIGEEEVRLAIDLTKELLKATYQYKTLVDRLRAFQKP